MSVINVCRYLDPVQRAEANLPAYPTDWTRVLQTDCRAGAAARGGPRSEEFVPLRDFLCWDSMAEGCSVAACTLLHPRHNGMPVCGRELTSVLELWGRRRRPPCAGDCCKAHLNRAELEAALENALPEGTRLHVRLQSPLCFGGGKAQCARSLHVVPNGVSPIEADAALDARSPMALRVAIDVGFDSVMNESERKSLATQCSLCHGIASEAEHRPHVRRA